MATGLFLAVAIGVGIFKIIIPTLTIIISVITGWEYDFEKINPSEIAGVYNAVSQEPLFNASGTSVWKKFGLRRLGKRYDRTVDPMKIEILSSVTKDDVEVDVAVKVNYRLIDALYFEMETGPDYLETLRADLYNTVDSSIKRESLDNLEKNINDGDLQKDIEEELHQIFLERGFELLSIVIYNVRSDQSIKKARQAKKIAEYEMAAKKARMKKKNEIIMEALQELERFYRNTGKIAEFNIDAAKKDLMVMMNEYNDEQIITITGVGGDANLVETLIAGFLNKKK